MDKPRDIMNAKVGDRVHITLVGDTKTYCSKGTITKITPVTEYDSASFEVVEDNHAQPIGMYSPGQLTLYTQEELDQEKAREYMYQAHVLDRHADSHGQINAQALAADASQHLGIFEIGESDPEGIPAWLPYLADDIAAEISLKACIATMRRKLAAIEDQLDQIDDGAVLYAAIEARHIATLITQDTEQIEELCLSNWD